MWPVPAGSVYQVLLCHGLKDHLMMKIKPSVVTHYSTIFSFLSDPGVPGVRSMGPVL